MTISHPKISTPPSNERLAETSVTTDHSARQQFSNRNSRITEFRLSGSKQSKRLFSNRNKLDTSTSQHPQEFPPQRHHRDHKNLVQCRRAIMATRLSPSHDAPLES